MKITIFKIFCFIFFYQNSSIIFPFFIQNIFCAVLYRWLFSKDENAKEIETTWYNDRWLQFDLPINSVEDSYISGKIIFYERGIDYQFEADRLIYPPGKEPFKERKLFTKEVCYFGTEKEADVYEDVFSKMSDEKLSEYLHTTTLKILLYLKGNRNRYNKNHNNLTEEQKKKYNNGWKEYYKEIDQVPQNYEKIVNDLISTGFTIFSEKEEEEEQEEVDESIKIFFSFGNFLKDILKEKTDIKLEIVFKFTDKKGKKYTTKKIIYKDEGGEIEKTMEDME